MSTKRQAESEGEGDDKRVRQVKDDTEEDEKSRLTRAFSRLVAKAMEKGIAQEIERANTPFKVDALELLAGFIASPVDEEVVKRAFNASLKFFFNAEHVESKKQTVEEVVRFIVNMRNDTALNLFTGSRKIDWFMSILNHLEK